MMHIPPVNYVYPSSIFAPEGEEAKGEGSPIFNNLLPELQGVVVAKMGYAARILFTWTCKTYHTQFVQRDQFDGQKLLDKCAKVGCRKLVAACVEEYSVPVDIVTICKATKKGYSYEELWKPFLSKIPLTSNPYGYDPRRIFSDIYFITAEVWAARGGHLKLSSELLVFSRSVRGELPSPDEQYVSGVPANLSPDRLIYQLAKGGHVDLAEWVYADLTDHQRTFLHESIGKSFIGLVFEGAVDSGNFPLVNWCIAKDPHVLDEKTYWDENDINLVGCLDLLMSRSMTYGSMEGCMLAVEKGWQPKEDGGEGAALIDLKLECLLESEFIPTSNHFACLQFLHATYADPDTVDVVNSNYDLDFPDWVDLEGFTWLHRQGYLPEIQKVFESYCHASRSKRKIMRHSKTSIDQIVDWFISKGAKITPEAFLKAASNDWIDLLNALWERKPDALPGNALEHTIEAGAEFEDKKQSQKPHEYDLDDDLGYKTCKKYRFKPLKRVNTLLRTVEWMLEKGIKLDDLQQQCDELALAIGRINKRAAKIFCNNHALKMHISEECRERIFSKEDIVSEDSSSDEEVSSFDEEGSLSDEEGYLSDR